MQTMMQTKQTIHYMRTQYFSRLTASYKSKEDMVRAHVKYVQKKAVAECGDPKNIINNIPKINKRVDSRVACKMILAVPNDIKEPDYERWLDDIRDFLSNYFNVDKEYIYTALHDKGSLSDELGTKNKHVHIVMTSRDRNNNRVRFDKKSDFYLFQQAWDAFLEERGYEIRYDSEDEKLEHIGITLKINPEVRKKYKEYLEAKIMKRNEIEIEDR